MEQYEAWNLRCPRCNVRPVYQEIETQTCNLCNEPLEPGLGPAVGHTTHPPKEAQSRDGWRALVSEKGAHGTMPHAGLLLWVIAGSLFIADVSFVIYLCAANREVRGIIAVVILAVLGIPSAWLWTVSSRMRQSGAVEVLREDGRPPILLLRAFAHDGLKVDSLDANSIRPTVETIIVNCVSNYGPVVAIGRPGEKLPPLGAARFWVDDEHWQQAVLQLLPVCQQVVLVMGKSPNSSGLAWEVGQILSAKTEARIWIVVPPRREDWIRLRWEEYALLAGGRFPEYTPGAVLIAFEPNGPGRVHRVGKSWYRGYVRSDRVYSSVLASAHAHVQSSPGSGY